MAMEEVTTQALKFQDYLNVPIVGYYMGPETRTDKEGKDYFVHVIISKKTGKRLVFNGFAILNGKLQNVQIGALVTIIYTGKENMKTQKGGVMPVNTCKVMQDTEDMYDTHQLPNAAHPMPSGPAPEPEKEPALPDPAQQDLPF